RRPTVCDTIRPRPAPASRNLQLLATRARFTCGVSHHQWEWLRGTNGGDLRGARESEPARARRPAAWRTTLDHDAGGKFSRISGWHRRAAINHEHARAGGAIRRTIFVWRSDGVRSVEQKHPNQSR